MRFLPPVKPSFYTHKHASRSLDLSLSLYLGRRLLSQLRTRFAVAVRLPAYRSSEPMHLCVSASKRREHPYYPPLSPSPPAVVAVLAVTITAIGDIRGGKPFSQPPTPTIRLQSGLRVGIIVSVRGGITL